ncbi:hypothetical protein OG264_22330 [Streptomyces xanthophaeus]|uniref:hypothetical protein n=1 Tax=Streptomyces xanthophaeus TaxID=67385 RepID=UPI00386C69AD|nr:hypothetical protein OG264_22330 [Streptomyces xanthophaeus]WST61038.1 hypothetical protein OG605_16115 [Streptomyces xanthophaeus]
MSEEFTGPPWAVDCTQDAEKYRLALAGPPREALWEALFELRTARNPYRGDNVEPARSTVPRGPHIAYFDNNRGWIRFTFLARVAEPQIVVEEIFWQ